VRIDVCESPLEADLTAYRGCELVIEAVVEDIAVKQALFAALE
jgi:3-hydroxyacyl-CoA dehydrogenase